MDNADKELLTDCADSAEAEPETAAVLDDQPAGESEADEGEDVSAEPTQPEAEPETAATSDDTESGADEKEKSAGGSRRRKIWIGLACVAVVAALATFFFCTHAILGNVFGKHDIYYSSTREIHLSGSDYSDYSQLSKVRSLETIDLTHSSFTDLSDLYGCKNLKSVKLSGKEMKAEDCIAFYRQVPGANLICRINIGGQVYDSGITALKVKDADEKTQRHFAALRQLEELNLTACDVSDDTYQVLSDSLKKCNILISTTICEKTYKTSADTVVFKGEITSTDVRRIGYFKSLSLIDLKNSENPEVLSDFISAHPGLRVNRPVELLGKTVGTEDECIDLRGSKYTYDQVKAALDEKLPELKSAKKIDMCGCGLSNKEMEQLGKEYPDIKFVWIVHFKRWSVRTDAVVFSTLNGNGYEFYDQNDYAPVFKYCTDLIALDLGHSLINDISPIASMKKLRAVILTDNKIRDISAFAELKDLEFIEINVNRVQSAEPLRDLQKLKYIDFWSSMAMTKLEPLYHHEELKLAIFHRTVSRAERARFMKSNPDCDTYFKVDTVKTTTNKAWRTNPYRKRVKKAFKNWKYVVGFDEETGKYIFDYKTDQYKYK
ncbi:MAG: hypothetical protein IIY89_05060 [Clostridia bacterium]|nr:hypothetical protein [Clostridia bacterium]